MQRHDVTKLEKDILFIFYSFSDQYGKVDIQAAKHWAYQKLGVTIPDTPFKFTQEHMNLLVEDSLVPDIRQPLANACKIIDKRKKPRTPKSSRPKNKDNQ